MSKARFFSSALDGQTVTLSATQGGVTRGPNTVSAWGGGVGGGDWEGVNPASLTVTVNEVLPVGDAFAPYPVEWRIRVTGTSYATPDWDPVASTTILHGADKSVEDTIRISAEAYDPSFQRCHFVVHTGDTGNYRNDWVGSAAHRNKAFEYGQNCGHVYSEPGTYTRSIYVYDDEGNWGTLALDDLLVLNPDDCFDAASTIVVNPAADPEVAGDWADAPAHDVANRFITMDAAAARFQLRKSNAATTKGMRICVKAGAEFNERARTFDTKDAKGPCLVDTYGGSGQFTYSERDLDVEVDSAAAEGGEMLFHVGDTVGWAWRIRDGIFDMGYDILNGRPTNASGWLGGPKAHSRQFFKSSFPAIIYDSLNTPLATKGDPRARIVFHNLDITGTCWGGIVTLASSEIEGRNVAIFTNDCHFYGNADYAFMAPQSLFALGLKVSTLANSDLGSMGRSMALGTPRGWAAHPIFLREQFAWTVYVRASYMESRGGWSGSSSQTTFRGGQPLMRLNNRGINEIPSDPEAGWVNGRGRRYYLCDSVMSGYFGLDIGGTGLTDTDMPIAGSHVVIENCFLFLDPASGGRESILYDFSGRSSLRNCVFLALDTPAYRLETMSATRDLSRWDVTDNWFGRFRQFITNDRDSAFKAGARAENRHNTFVMLREDSAVEGTFNVRGPNNSGETFDPETYEVVEGHNVVYAPNLSSPLGPASMETINLPSGMRALDVWIKLSWEIKAFTLASAVASGAETPAIEYPIDWYKNATTGADYAGSAGNNTLETEANNDLRWFEPPGTYLNAGGSQAVPGGNRDEITVIHDCDASGVVQGDGTGTHFKIENRSPDEWPAGDYRVILDRGSTGMAAETPATPDTQLQAIDQSTFKLYRSTTPQALDSGLGSLLFDFNRNLRPNAGFAISPNSGTNAAGAILPAE